LKRTGFVRSEDLEREKIEGQTLNK
jgi:hypothetical protein